MTLYTSKVIAQWLCLTERRVRQLRDEGVIVEARPGLYELQPTVARYIKYLGGAGKDFDTGLYTAHTILYIRVEDYGPKPKNIETTILDKDCSPAAVLGFAMIEGKKFKTSLSVPTIYKYIAKGLFLNLTQEELPRHGKKKHKYKKVKKNKSASRAPAGESIEQRPEEIDEREEFGHWEGDTVYSGKGKRKTTRALLTLTERKTRKEIIIAIPNRKAETVVKALDALERKLGARRFRAIFKSITFDNGTEFAAAEELERSCVNKRLPRTKVYFCHPYSSWERGTNENTNGMIRRRFPKGTNFAAVTNAQITQAENWINNYPRKILGYKSSEIVFRECLRELGIAA